MSDGPLTTIGGIVVSRRGLAFTWLGPLAVDADGAPDAYAPAGSGLEGRDDLANSGHGPQWLGASGRWHDGTPPDGALTRPADWWGLACAGGIPVVQDATDPAPGYYVSTTALVDPGRRESDPRRYVDANTVPYLSVPPELRTLGVHMGDVALVEYRAQWSPAIVADVGPHGKLGEGSIALARALGLDASPRHGGAGGGVRVTLWPGTAAEVRWPRLAEDIAAQVDGLRAVLPGA